MATTPPFSMAPDTSSPAVVQPITVAGAKAASMAAAMRCGPRAGEAK